METVLSGSGEKKNFPNTYKLEHRVEKLKYKGLHLFKKWLREKYDKPHFSEVSYRIDRCLPNMKKRPWSYNKIM